METYEDKDEWSSRFVPSIHLLVEKQLADIKIADGSFLPISATLTSAGRERCNKELSVDFNTRFKSISH